MHLMDGEIRARHLTLLYDVWSELHEWSSKSTGVYILPLHGFKCTTHCHPRWLDFSLPAQQWYHTHTGSPVPSSSDRDPRIWAWGKAVVLG
jgi:hypothetical protein